MCPPDATRWLQNHTSVGLVCFFFFFRFTKSLRWPANVAAGFVFWLLFLIVYKEIVRGEDKYCVIVFLYDRWRCYSWQCTFPMCYVFIVRIYVPCAPAALEHKLWARFSLRLVSCDLSLQACHHTCCQSSLLCCQSHKDSFFYIKRTWHTRVMLTIILWFFFPPVLLQTLEHEGHSLW